jgi:saccharopine dehydrogenase (NAD+, L-lysine-forming)
VACAEEVARAALACGVDYLDIQYSSKKWARLRPFQERIRQAGRCFITEAGLLPGLPSALSRIAAVDFESTDTARVELCIQPDPAKPLTNEVLAELVEELRDYEASVLQDGQWKKTRIGRPAEADFGHPLGKRRVFPIGLEEMRGLPGALPGLRDASCSIAGMNWFVDWMLMPLIPLSYRLKKGAPQRMPRLLGWGLRQFATAPYGAAAQVHVLGRRGGAPGERHVQVYHPDEYALTAAPVAACLLQYLDGSARKPGLWCMGHLVEPRRFASDLQRMGIELTTRDGVSARVTAGF